MPSKVVVVKPATQPLEPDEPFPPGTWVRVRSLNVPHKAFVKEIHGSGRTKIYTLTLVSHKNMDYAAQANDLVMAPAKADVPKDKLIRVEGYYSGPMPGEDEEDDEDEDDEDDD